MKNKPVMVLVCAALTLMSLNGCVVALGNRVPESERKGVATLGKQLSDLKQARDSGAITEEEYESAKKRLIDGK